MVLIHPKDQHLLGVKWQEPIFIDRILPFSLKSAPKIRTEVADAIRWILARQGVSKSLHYLDDFVLVAHSWSSVECQKQNVLSLFATPGIPVEPSKLESPSCCLTFLGIEVDTLAFQLCLPSQKLSMLLNYLHCCAYQRTVTKHDVKQLTGLPVDFIYVITIITVSYLQCASNTIKPVASLLGIG